MSKDKIGNLFKDMAQKEVYSAQKIAMNGIKDALTYLKLTHNSTKDFIEEILVKGNINCEKFLNAGMLVTEGKVIALSKEDISNCDDSLESHIEQCGKDKAMLESMARWVYKVELDKRSSFDKMVAELRQQVSKED
jgi:hypothetical protein